MTKIGVLGAGTWGMALARMLCCSGCQVTVWSALPQEVEQLQKPAASQFARHGDPLGDPLYRGYPSGM